MVDRQGQHQFLDITSLFQSRLGAVEHCPGTICDPFRPGSRFWPYRPVLCPTVTGYRFPDSVKDKSPKSFSRGLLFEADISTNEAVRTRAPTRGQRTTRPFASPSIPVRLRAMFEFGIETAEISALARKTNTSPAAIPHRCRWGVM